MGRYVAKVIEAELKDGGRAVGRQFPKGAEDCRPSEARKLRAKGFHYRDYGSMATVGKSRAVVEIGRLRFGGFLAWLAWMALHITVLIGFRNRLAVLSSWIYAYLFYRRGSRLITGLAPTSIKQPIAPATSRVPAQRTP
jgi:NADH dehydrogenase